MNFDRKRADKWLADLKNLKEIRGAYYGHERMLSEDVEMATALLAIISPEAIEAIERVVIYLEFVSSAARSLEPYSNSAIHQREDGIRMAIRAVRKWLDLMGEASGPPPAGP